LSFDLAGSARFNARIHSSTTAPSENFITAAAGKGQRLFRWERNERRQANFFIGP
jgi:hypothetical protein